MNNAHHRGPWDKGSTDVMYMTNEEKYSNLLNNLPTNTTTGGSCVILLGMRTSILYMSIWIGTPITVVMCAKISFGFRISVNKL